MSSASIILVIKSNDRSEWKYQLIERRSSSVVWQLFCITPVGGALQFQCPHIFEFYVNLNCSIKGFCMGSGSTSIFSCILDFSSPFIFVCRYFRNRTDRKGQTVKSGKVHRCNTLVDLVGTWAVCLSDCSMHFLSPTCSFIFISLPFSHSLAVLHNRVWSRSDIFTALCLKLNPFCI